MVLVDAVDMQARSYPGQTQSGHQEPTYLELEVEKGSAVERERRVPHRCPAPTWAARRESPIGTGALSGQRGQGPTQRAEHMRGEL